MRFGDVITVNPESIQKGYQYEEIEYIDISSVGTGTLSATQRLRVADAPSRAKRIVKSGDTLLATVRPNLRSFWYARDPDENVIASTGFAVLRAGKDVDSRFLYYTVTNQQFSDYLTANAKGSAYPAVDTDTIARANIFLPSLPTQRKIAAILAAFDDLIENNLRRIKILEEMAQNLYREWFVKFRFPGHEHARFVDSPLGLIPEGWEVKTVGNTFTILGGGTPSKEVPEYWSEGMVNWYSPSNLTSAATMFMDESVNKINELGLKMSSARMFPPYSVMMTSRATIGVVSINTTSACTNQGFITCIPNENFPLYMLFFWLKENVEYFISLGTGSTFKEIIKGVFKNIELSVPPKAIVSEYSTYVVPMANQVLNLQRRNSRLRNTRDLLLPKLISGEIDVSELDITVPEEVHS
jgi:type I restriction enzyme S subunit